jgi:hypothetical protein
MPQQVDCPSTDHSANSGLSAEEVQRLISGELCGSLIVCSTCTLISRGEQANRALTLTGANIPLLRSRVGILT